MRSKTMNRNINLVAFALFIMLVGGATLLLGTCELDSPYLEVIQERIEQDEEDSILHDTENPVVGTAISIGTITQTTVALTWGAASDNRTETGNIRYRVSRATTSTELGSLELALQAEISLDWTTGITSCTVTALDPSTQYWFAVLVKDEAGNTSLYVPKQAVTLEAGAPTPGTGPAFTSVAATGMTVNWTAASDDTTAQGNLQYKLVRADSVEEIDTVAEANGPGVTVEMDWTAAILTNAVTGLEESTEYAFAVLVKDEASNISLYTPQLQRTSLVFMDVEQTGGSSGSEDSTGLTLIFGTDPTPLTAGNITVTGATKGALSGSGPTRSLIISDITVADGETVEVTITSPAGYTITGSPKTAVVYRYNAPLILTGAVQTGGSSGTVDSTGLLLSFSDDPTSMTAAYIEVVGATKGSLSGSGTTRTLGISDITVGNGATVSVAISSPPGYSMSGSPITVVVYRAPYVGLSYQGGVIAYIFQSGDPGYVSGETHGLIAATEDQSTSIIWAIDPYWEMDVPGGGARGTTLGTGSVNTDRIIEQNGAGTSYAAGLARAHSGGGYDDWFLPSKDELNKLYLNRAAVGGFSSEIYYWSSSESVFEAYAAWFQDFSDGSQHDNLSKYYWAGVRAVRAF
jgi:hypothetical protein